MNRLRWSCLLAVTALLAPSIRGPAAAAPLPEGTDLPAAVRAAGDQAVLDLGAGTFHGPILVSGQTLIIRGAGPGRTWLTAPAAGAPPLPGDAGAFIRVARGGRLVLENLSLELDGGWQGAAIVIDGAFRPTPEPPGPDYQLTLVNGCLTGGNRPGSVGLLVDGTAGPAGVRLENMIVEQWDFAIRTLGPGAQVSVTNSRLSPNLAAAFDNSGSGVPQEARYNWWGSGDGPSGAGPGTGEAVLGPGVAFAPWRLFGTDVDPLCGFNPPPDNVVFPGPSDTCLSTAHPCATIPILVSRSDNAPVRGFSVTLQLSPELQLCPGPNPVFEGSYLPAVNPLTDFHLLDNGGGSYTVDDAILGLPCGATAPAGTLFHVRVGATVPSGTGTITVTSVLLRDCDNAPVPGSPGPPVTVTIDAVPTGPVTGLAASQLKTGNDGDGTTKILLTFTPPPGAASVTVVRAGFGNYPEYDDPPGPGAAPAPPTWPPAPPWQITPVTGSGQFDEPAARDVWYYAAFAADGCGNVSAASALTPGTLNYHLGDFHDGSADCAGDNGVGTADLSMLGAHYGVSLAVSDPLGCLDVGPTLDAGVDTRPVTDNILDFEDLIILALNYGGVSKPTRDPPEAERLAVIDRLELSGPEDLEPGAAATLSVRLNGSGRIHGLSLAFDPEETGFEILEAAPGAGLAAGGRPAVVLPGGRGVVDLALLGPGPGLAGEAEILRLDVRRLDRRPFRPVIRRVIARDGGNREVPVETGPAAAAPPPLTRLGSITPRAGGGAEIAFTLARGGRTDLVVFDILGRPVRRLLSGVEEAGLYRTTWDGRATDGRSVSAGIYFVRLAADGVVETRRFFLSP